MPPQQQTLVITNAEAAEMSVHCQSKSLPHLSVQFESCLLSNGESARATIEFRPCEPVKYLEIIKFEVNGFFEKAITIRGEGSQMKIELANSAHKIVNFGTLQIDERGTAYCSRTVKLVNRSLTPLNPSLSIVPSSSVPALQQDGVLTIDPSGEMPMKANGGSCKVVVAFRPTCRVPQFTEEVTLECQGTSQPLFVVTGACHGLEIALDTEYIPFGAVVHGTASTRKLLMINSGDIGAAFRWKMDEFAPHFSIVPKDGYISPGMHVSTMYVNWSHFHTEGGGGDNRYRSA
jgi:hydrocephalus-inducing protein